jgi:3',5'-cyclic AMP phosphodiesterase CpdA
MTTPRTRRLLAVLFLCAVALGGHLQAGQAPGNSLRFAVIGDFGTATTGQYEIGKAMAAVNARSRYDLVLTVGDNIYATWNAQSVAERFEKPYRALLDAGVPFFASLGNHDAIEERQYPLFNMGGQRFYTFSRLNAQFFALDSNYMDAEQLTWLRRELEASKAAWKIAYFHHPLYSSAQRHGAQTDLRVVLEPLFIQYGLQVVFSGHDHVYERLKPQRGISYFVCGSSGQLRKGNLNEQSADTAAGFDQDLAFMVVEIEGDTLRFQAISRTEMVVDSGVIQRAATR